MTKKDFFRIIIKLFGLYGLIISLFYLLPNSFQYTVYGLEYMIVALVILAFIIIVCIYVIIIQKTDWIIKVLKLDKNFDEDRIELGNFKSIQLYQLALIIIGGYLIIDYFPSFLRDIYVAFKKAVSRFNLSPAEQIILDNEYHTFNIVMGAISIVLGYLMISNNKRLANWLDKKAN